MRAGRGRQGPSRRFRGHDIGMKVFGGWWTGLGKGKKRFAAFRTNAIISPRNNRPYRRPAFRWELVGRVLEYQSLRPRRLKVGLSGRPSSVALGNRFCRNRIWMLSKALKDAIEKRQNFRDGFLNALMLNSKVKVSVP